MTFLVSYLKLLNVPFAEMEIRALLRHPHSDTFLNEPCRVLPNSMNVDGRKAIQIREREKRFLYFLRKPFSQRRAQIYSSSSMYRRAFVQCPRPRITFTWKSRYLLDLELCSCSSTIPTHPCMAKAAVFSFTRLSFSQCYSLKIRRFMKF